MRWRKVLELTAWTPAVVAGVLAAGVMLLSAPAWPAWLQQFTSPGVVQNYALFTRVTQGDLVITTGSNFVSTTDQRVDHQWCYLERDALGGDALSPTIALADAKGVATYPALAPTTLTALKLSAAEIRSIGERHCRFLKQ